MSANDHLSPRQFGFTKVSYDEWRDAVEKTGYAEEKGWTHENVDFGAQPIHTGQKYMWRSRVKELADPENFRESSEASPLEMFHVGGKLYQAEGHHRIAAMRKRGETSAQVRMYREQ